MLGENKAKQNSKGSFWESQKIAKEKSYEKRASTKKIKLDALVMFTQQLAAMLKAGLSLIMTLEALQDQTNDPVFRVIIRNIGNDISAGSAFSEAVKRYPNAFPSLFTSMVEAGEASGSLADMMQKVAEYMGATLKLTKKVKSAMTYPAVVILLAVALVNVLLIFVIPVFSEMFSSFGSALPAPTQLLIDVSDFLKSNIVFLAIGLFGFFYALGKYIKTPGGRIVKDRVISRMPIAGKLSRLINVSRFCRTYGVLLRSGVPVLRILEICSSASNNVFIEDACSKMRRTINDGGQLSEALTTLTYFPIIVMHMARAGEQTGNIDTMMNNIADFYDMEIDNMVASLTSLIEPFLIVFLGVVIGGIVMAMFLPIFELSNVVGGNK